jgi:hypothetical protein
LQQAGYKTVATFILPDYCWTENFFKPQTPIQNEFLLKHDGNTMAEELVANLRHEAVLYEKYSAFYGYVFFIGKKL